MTRAIALPRSLIVLGVCIPLALVLGYFLASPDEYVSLVGVGLIGLVLTLPILLRWHHPILIFTWNAWISVFFLPGSPSVWMLVAGMSLVISALSHILNREQGFQEVRSLTLPVLFLLAVVLLTAEARGGIGVRALGSASYGGKGYFYIVAAIIGYFALSARRIPLPKASFYSGALFLSGLTGVMSNVAYAAGPAFWWLFMLFPVEFSISQIKTDLSVTDQGPMRLVGLAFGALSGYYFLMMRYGLRGIFDLRRPWRLALLGLVISLSLLGGFRSTVVIIAMIFMLHFFLEGLHRTRWLAVLLFAGVLGAAFLLTAVDRLPLTFQRSLSLVPFLKVDAGAKADAQVSIEWRTQMWKVMWPEVPKYLLLGKGYVINPYDMFLAYESTRRGFTQNFEPALIAGDYHSGPLSVLIPFGLWGVLGVIWLWIASLRVLHRNYRYGDPVLLNINRFLLAYYIMRVVTFLFVFGSLYMDLMLFMGTIGLSVSLNGGVRSEKDLPPASGTG